MVSTDNHEEKIKSAANQAIEKMPEDFTMRSFFQEHRQEIIDMVVAEYEEEQAFMQWREYEDRSIERCRQIQNAYKALTNEGIDQNGTVQRLSQQFHENTENIRKALKWQEGRLTLISWDSLEGSDVFGQINPIHVWGF